MADDVMFPADAVTVRDLHDAVTARVRELEADHKLLPGHTVSVAITDTHGVQVEVRDANGCHVDAYAYAECLSGLDHLRSFKLAFEPKRWPPAGGDDG